MLLKELFNQQNLNCPRWAEDIFLEDDWSSSEYSNEEGINKWVFKNDIKHLVITFDGDQYILEGFDSEGVLLLREVRTEDEISVT